MLPLAIRLRDSTSRATAGASAPAQAVCDERLEENTLSQRYKRLSLKSRRAFVSSRTTLPRRTVSSGTAASSTIITMA